jgi:hypothetical protein
MLVVAGAGKFQIEHRTENGLRLKRYRAPSWTTMYGIVRRSSNIHNAAIYSITYSRVLTECTGSHDSSVALFVVILTFIMLQYIPSCIGICFESEKKIRIYLRILILPRLSQYINSNMYI